MAKPGKAVGNKFFVALARRLGIPQRNIPNAVRFFRAQQSGEGTSATWNPLATTRGDAGYASNFNSVGVKNFASFQQGLRNTVGTYTNGHYDGILQDLRQGVRAERIATNRLDELHTWGTGSLVAARLGSTSTPNLDFTGPSRPGRRNPRQSTSDEEFTRNLIALIMMRRQGGGSSLGSFALISSLFNSPASATTRPGRRPQSAGSETIPSGARFYRPGRGLLLPAPNIVTSHTTHPTSGLAGYPAIDVGADWGTDLPHSPGTPVYAPFSGTISRLSGHSGGTAGGAAGASVYIRGAGGEAFITHMDWDRRWPGLKVGTKIRRGQLIGYVMAYPGGAHHIHYGFKSS